MDTDKMAACLGQHPPSQENTTTWVKCADCGEEFMKLIDGLCLLCSDRRKFSGEKRAQNDQRLISAIGKKGFEFYTFDKFKPDAGTQKAYDAAIIFDENKRSLYLWGPAGCGKTHLACSIFRQRTEAEFYKATELIRWFRMRDPRAEEEKIKILASVPLLILDDLGVQKDSEHCLGILYEIFDRRDMGLRHGLVITSNLSMKDLAQKMGDDRIPSRIAGMCDVIEMRGKDRRVS